MSILRISIAVLILAVAGILLADSLGHAQNPDPYVIQERVAVNAALLDQVLVHDAETNATFKEINRHFGDQETEIRDIGSRMSHMEGGAGAVIALLGLFLGLPYLPDKWKRKNP